MQMMTQEFRVTGLLAALHGESPSNVTVAQPGEIVQPSASFDVRDRFNVEGQNVHNIFETADKRRLTRIRTGIRKALSFICVHPRLSAVSNSHSGKTPVDKYRSPRSAMITTIVAFSTSLDIRNAALVAPPDEIPQKIPSSRARPRVVSSASFWVISRI